MTCIVISFPNLEFISVHQVHSYMVFNIIGEMSTFIDFDEIQINRQLIIGDGAYGTVYRGKVCPLLTRFHFDILTRVTMYFHNTLSASNNNVILQYLVEL